MAGENEKSIRLTVLNQKEVLRLLGNRNTDFGMEPPAKMKKLMVECQRELIQTARPRFTYKVYDADDPRLPLIGADINLLLSKCEKVVFIATTLSVETDMLIRRSQIHDMSKAVILDAMASVAVEQVCDKLGDMLEDDYPDYRFTRRFSPGYGDFPIDVQEDFVTLVDASRKIGLTVTESGTLAPIKSVTAIMGMAYRPSRFSEKIEEEIPAGLPDNDKLAEPDTSTKHGGARADGEVQDAVTDVEELLAQDEKELAPKRKKQNKKSFFTRFRKEKAVPVYEGIDLEYIKNGSSAKMEQERDIFNEEQPMPVTGNIIKPAKKAQAVGPSAITWPESSIAGMTNRYKMAPGYKTDRDSRTVNTAAASGSAGMSAGMTRAKAANATGMKITSAAKATGKSATNATVDLKHFLIDNDFEALPAVTYAPGLGQSAGAMRRAAKESANDTRSSHNCETCNMKDSCSYRRDNKHCDIK